MVPSAGMSVRLVAGSVTVSGAPSSVGAPGALPLAASVLAVEPLAVPGSGALACWLELPASFAPRALFLAALSLAALSTLALCIA